jgi:predicted DNA-binding transcriptional regulator
MQSELVEMDETGNEDLELGLTGRTMRVYWYMLQNREPLGRRDIQRGVNLSSASLAEYHLKKLVGMGLAEKNAMGEYYIYKTVQLGVMRFYLIFMSSLIPRFVLYITFYVTALILVLVFFSSLPLPALILILSILIFGIVTSLIESIILWKSSPR